MEKKMFEIRATRHTENVYVVMANTPEDAREIVRDGWSLVPVKKYVADWVEVLETKEVQ